MLIGAIGLGAVLCGLAAFRAGRLAVTALSLAGVSACTAMMLYTLGAPHLAVVELSVGISLVTVLLVYGIAMTGESEGRHSSIVPPRFAAALAGLVFVLAATLGLPVAGAMRPAGGTSLTVTLWSQRGLDVVVQVVMICVGALGVLTVLGAERTPGRRGPSRNGQGAAIPTSREQVLR